MLSQMASEGPTQQRVLPGLVGILPYTPRIRRAMASTSYCTWKIIPVSISHLDQKRRGISPGLGDLLTIVINHIQNGMILQVDGSEFCLAWKAWKSIPAGVRKRIRISETITGTYSTTQICSSKLNI